MTHFSRYILLFSIVLVPVLAMSKEGEKPAKKASEKELRLPSSYEIACNNFGNRFYRKKADFTDSGDGLFIKKQGDKISFRVKDISRYDGELSFEIDAKLCGESRVDTGKVGLPLITCEPEGQPKGYLNVDVTHWKYVGDKKVERDKEVEKVENTPLNIRVRQLHTLGASHNTSNNDMTTYGFVIQRLNSNNKAVDFGQTRFIKLVNCLSDIK